MDSIKQIKLNPEKVWSVLFKKIDEYKINEDVLVKLENNTLNVYVKFEDDQTQHLIKHIEGIETLNISEKTATILGQEITGVWIKKRDILDYLRKK